MGLGAMEVGPGCAERSAPADAGEEVVPVELARSALEAARAVLQADFCAFVWTPAGGAELAVVASRGIAADRARRMASAWMAAAEGRSGRDRRDPATLRMLPTRRIEPVLDPSGRVRGALIASLRGAARPGDGRLLMPVFATHLALLVERTQAQARRTDDYEALLHIGMEIQAAEEDVDEALGLIVGSARDLLGTDLAWLGLVDEEAGTLEMEVAVGATTQPFMEMRLALGDGVGGVVVASRRPVVLPDYRAAALPTPPAVRDAVLGEGVGSMLCAPMLHGPKVVGALYVGSRRPNSFSKTDVALTCALAAQAAVAVENARLYQQLRRKNEVLERSAAVHRELTDAALAGAGLPEICSRLARLLGREVVLDQDVLPPFVVACDADGTPRPCDAPPPAAAGHLTFPIAGDVELGRLHVGGPGALTGLQQRTVEHGATVLALELVKQRAAQEVGWQLQGDLLNELLDAASPVPATLEARARRHGLDLAVAHRVVAVAPLGPAGPDEARGVEELLALIRRVTGRGALGRDAPLVHLRGEHVVLAVRDAPQACADVVAAVTAAAERGGRHVAIGIGEPGTVLSAGLRQAVACAQLLRAEPPARTVTVHAERLGPLRFLLDAPDPAQVRRIVQEQLGPLLAPGGRGDARTGLYETLRAFVAADGSVAEAAAACFVHKNTLRYRLGRIGEILGRDPAAPSTRFELRLAFDLLALFDGLGIDLLAPDGDPRATPSATGLGRSPARSPG
jgi:GAF domain-containing protein/sugar diacid utilization regulator